MQPTKKLRLLLVLGGLLATGIGAALLFAPLRFLATNGIQISADINLLSELRAPGGALLAFGVMMLIGAFVRAFTVAATVIGATVFLAYGGARLVSIGLDGVPGPGLLAATAIELALGTLCAIALLRPAMPSMGQERLTQAVGQARGGEVGTEDQRLQP